MMKKMLAVMMVLALVLGAQAAMAEEYAVQKENALAAAKVSLPEANVDYAVRERDGKRIEWNLFFVQGDQLGVCKVLEETNEIRRVELFKKAEGALTASEAVAKLAEKKGALQIVELDLDWDDGRLAYEGEAELDGKRYEFEMSADGSIIEWERD